MLFRSLFPFSLEDELQVEKAFDQAVLKIERPGRLDSIQWVGQPAVAPQGNEVEIEVHVTGANFRVSLKFLGIENS